MKVHLLLLFILVLLTACVQRVGKVTEDPNDCIDHDGDRHYDDTIPELCPGADDCDDNNYQVYPHAPELCDGVDNQCPGDPGYGQIDEGCPSTNCNTDADGDHYPPADGCIRPRDCNDHNSAIHPGAREICGNGIDEDCDGRDTPCINCIDGDRDGYITTRDRCGNDCNDDAFSINPGAPEICGNSIDENCDGFDNYCCDNDADGYTLPDGCYNRPPDCNNNDPTIYPNAPELCDGKDNQCPGNPGYGEIDEGCSIPPCQYECDPTTRRCTPSNAPCTPNPQNQNQCKDTCNCQRCPYGMECTNEVGECCEGTCVCPDIQCDPGEICSFVDMNGCCTDCDCEKTCGFGYICSGPVFGDCCMGDCLRPRTCNAWCSGNNMCGCGAECTEADCREACNAMHC